MKQNNHSGHWGIKPLPPHPLKTPLLSCQAPLKSANFPNPPFFRQCPPTYWFFETPPHPLKVGSFIERPKYLSFSSLIPSYLLKATKLLGGISQFQFLVMTEKNILAYKLFLSLNISYFNLFLCENCNPCYKIVTNLFSQQTLSKVEVLSNNPLFENLVGSSTPSPPTPTLSPCRGDGYPLR